MKSRYFDHVHTPNIHEMDFIRDAISLQHIICFTPGFAFLTGMIREHLQMRLEVEDGYVGLFHYTKAGDRISDIYLNL